MFFCDLVQLQKSHKQEIKISVNLNAMMSPFYSSTGSLVKVIGDSSDNKLLKASVS